MCVAEAGPLDLLLTVRSEESARSTGHKGPGLEVEFSGGQVHLMPCADSFVALQDIIMYLAQMATLSPVVVQGLLRPGSKQPHQV